MKRSPTMIAYTIKRMSPYNAQIAVQVSEQYKHRRGRHNSLTPEIAIFFNQHLDLGASEVDTMQSCNTCDDVLHDY